MVGWADVWVYGSVDGWVWEAAAVHALLSPQLIEFIMCPSLAAEGSLEMQNFIQYSTRDKPDPHTHTYTNTHIHMHPHPAPAHTRALYTYTDSCSHGILPAWCW